MKKVQMTVRLCLLIGGALGLGGSAATGQTTRPSPAAASAPARDILSPQQWKLVDDSVERALAWLATRQEGEGGFQTLDTGQPGVTSLCALAFLARGHVPGEGRYGEVLNRAIQYALDCQRPDGVFSRIDPTATSLPGNPSRAAHYNHAITGLLLSEAYGMTSVQQSRSIRPAIEKAIKYASLRLPQPKRSAIYEGGWRYRTYNSADDADLTVTSWHLMFLRSCKNAGFEVPGSLVEDALQYVGRVYRPERGTFVYAVREATVTRALAGAGILSLSLAGKHNDDRAQQAGQFLLNHPFVQYNVRAFPTEHYFYSCFYCSQAMFQLGGKYWEEFYPVLARTLTANQRPNGSWDPDCHDYDAKLGRTYTTALGVLALSPPYQLLPIFQR